MLEYNFEVFKEEFIREGRGYTIWPGIAHTMMAMPPANATGLRSPRKQTTMGTTMSKNPKKLVLKTSPRNKIPKDKRTKAT